MEKIKTKKFLIIAMYILLLAGCLGMVYLISRLADRGRDQNRETQQTGPVKPGREPQKGMPATPAEASPTEASSGREVRRPVRRPEPELPEEPKPEYYTLPSLVLATDVHYFSPQMTDFGKAFEKKLLADDGKTLRYSTELLEAFLDEVIERNPSALILSGDLTFNGEKVNHQELANHLKRVQEAGIQVLIIPGNHDINNKNAASYFGEMAEEAERVTPEEFYQIYHEFGYKQAFARDENSLSYMYALDDYNWLMMLDSCQYEPENKVGGKLSQETYAWIREQLDAAARVDIRVVPVAHHNLLPESRLYPTDCAIEGYAQLINTLETWKTPLYLSGHLHLQRVKQYKPLPSTPDDEYHIREAVTASLSIPPFQYSIVDWTENRGFIYQTRTVDVSGWAGKQGIEDENLLNFDEYGIRLMDEAIESQLAEQLRYSLPQEQLQAMGHLYSVLNRDYCAGNKVELQDIYDAPAYGWWERNLPDTRQFLEIHQIAADIRAGGQDCNYLEVPGEWQLPSRYAGFAATASDAVKLDEGSGVNP